MDGVLVRPSSQERHKHIKHDKEPDDLYKKLENEFGIDYSIYDKYDVGASYYDVDKYAVHELQRVIDETGAKIVVSSDWRTYRPKNMMKDLLTMHGLGEYVVDIVPHNGEDYEIDPNPFKSLITSDSLEYLGRGLELLEYLKVHQDEVENYVIIDDLDVSYDIPIFTDHLVLTRFKLTKECADKAIDILNKNFPDKLLPI